MTTTPVTKGYVFSVGGTDRASVLEQRVGLDDLPCRKKRHAKDAERVLLSG